MNQHGATHVRLTELGFRPSCTCGWRGTERASLARMIEECVGHCKPYVPHVECCTAAHCELCIGSSAILAQR